jgi:periplasmic protein TonB
MKKILVILSMLFVQKINAQIAVDTNLSIKNAIKNVDKFAAFPGGENNLIRYLSSKLVYPKRPRESGIQGTVHVEFVICEDGKVCNLHVVKSTDKELDAEALRVLAQMPKWKPAEQNNKIVPCYFTIPITFALEDAPAKKR